MADPDLLSGEHLVTSPFVAGCADLRHQGRMELIAYRVGQSIARSSLCVEIQTGRGVSASCRDPREKLHGLEFGFFIVHSRRWLHFQGFASLGVARVRLRYHSLGELRRPRGIVTRVTDPALLARLALSGPFAHYVAEASLRAGSVLLLARNRVGKLIFWRSTPDVRDIVNPEGGETIGTLP